MTPTTTEMQLSAAARAFVLDQRVARLATAGADGTPHVVPICYALVEEALYFVVDDKPKRSRTGLRRLRNIAANPRVAVVVDRYSDNWDQLAYVLIHGTAAVVTAPDEYDRVLVVLRSRYPQYTAMAIAMPTHPMVRITIAVVHAWRLPQGG